MPKLYLLAYMHQFVQASKPQHYFPTYVPPGNAKAIG